jgi:replicative DNA helicase
VVVAGERLPPQNLEAEQSVLGAMLIEKEAIFTVGELLNEQDFYRTAHQKIFAGIITLSEKGEPVDLVTISEELQRRRFLEEAGGMAYLMSLANAVPTAANVQYYANIVREKAILRALINKATAIVTRCYESSSDVEEALDIAEQEIFEIGRHSKQQGFAPLKEALMEAFDRIERLFDEKKGVTGLSHRVYRSGPAQRWATAVRSDYYRRPAQHGQDNAGAKHRTPYCRQREENGCFFQHGDVKRAAGPAYALRPG